MTFWPSPCQLVAPVWVPVKLDLSSRREVGLPASQSPASCSLSVSVTSLCVAVSLSVACLLVTVICVVQRLPFTPCTVQRQCCRGLLSAVHGDWYPAAECDLTVGDGGGSRVCYFEGLVALLISSCPGVTYPFFLSDVCYLRYTPLLTSPPSILWRPCYILTSHSAWLLLPKRITLTLTTATIIESIMA